MAIIQRAITAFALKQHDDLTVMFDGVINFFAFFNADIGNKLRYDLRRIEDIIAQRCDEWHHKSVLGGFLRFNEVFLLADLGRNSLQNFDKVHVLPPSWFYYATFIDIRTTNNSLFHVERLLEKIYKHRSLSRHGQAVSM